MKTEPEKITREKRINSRLTSAPLNWTVIPWKQGMDTSGLDAHAVEEYPTQTGPADYTLFVKGQLLGINLLDHIIFNHKDYYSFLENDQL
jgi:type I restriction enzyme R subunit